MEHSIRKSLIFCLKTAKNVFFWAKTYQSILNRYIQDEILLCKYSVAKWFTLNFQLGTRFNWETSSTENNDWYRELTALKLIIACYSYYLIETTVIICFSYCCFLKGIEEGVLVNLKVIKALGSNLTLTVRWGDSDPPMAGLTPGSNFFFFIFWILIFKKILWLEKHTQSIHNIIRYHFILIIFTQFTCKFNKKQKSYSCQIGVNFWGQCYPTVIDLNSYIKQVS